MEKSYKARSNTAKYIAVYHLVIHILGELPIFSLRESLIIRIAGVAIFWGIFFSTPFRYTFGTLYINSKEIYKTGFRGHISYNKANVVVCSALNSLFFAFSEEVLQGKSKKEIFSLCKQNKAILFPWHPQIEKDFPHFFQKDNNI